MNKQRRSVRPTRPNAVAEKQADASGHIRFLDGLRGVTALYVVLHHAYMHLFDAPEIRALDKAFFDLYPVFSFHRCVVAIFIVLSGYCLTQSVLRNDSVNFSMSGGLKSYF